MASVDSAIAVIIMIASLMVGGLVLAVIGSETQDQLQKVGDNESLTEFTDVKKTGWGALRMLAISGIVAGGVVILALLKRLAG